MLLENRIISLRLHFCLVFSPLFFRSFLPHLFLRTTFPTICNTLKQISTRNKNRAHTHFFLFRFPHSPRRPRFRFKRYTFRQIALHASFSRAQCCYFRIIIIIFFSFAASHQYCLHFPLASNKKINGSKLEFHWTDDRE